MVAVALGLEQNDPSNAKACDPASADTLLCEGVDTTPCGNVDAGKALLRAGLTSELPDEWIEAVRAAKVPDEYAHLDAELLRERYLGEQD